MTKDEMVGWHHCLSGHEFEQTLGDVEGQESLACCSPWGCKELDMTEQLTTMTPEVDTFTSNKILMYRQSRYHKVAGLWSCAMR